MGAFKSDEPFFIGWLPMPAPYRRVLLPVAVGLVLAAAATAATLALLQRDPGTGDWQAAAVRTFDGVVFARPYALLRVPGEGTFLLVEEGKFGALERVAPLVEGHPEGRAVRVRGTVLQRDGRSMLELVAGDDGLRPLSAGEASGLSLGWPAPVLLAEEVTLRGEIIDPKCYLGVTGRLERHGDLLVFRLAPDGVRRR
jgi:hypothetical protein